MQGREHYRSAFLEWIDATKAGIASCRDRRFMTTSGQEFPTAYLLGYMSTNTDILPDDYTWIITDNIGQDAVRSYENAVQVVRDQRKQ